MSGEAGNLVSKTFRWNDSHFFQNLLVGMEVESHFPVVPLDHYSRGFLNGFGSYTTHSLAPPSGYINLKLKLMK
ncbi:hypothetical protein Hanom_Chr14g01318731 [Helianthus anomalus]